MWKGLVERRRRLYRFLADHDWMQGNRGSVHQLTCSNEPAKECSHHSRNDGLGIRAEYVAFAHDGGSSEKCLWVILCSGDQSTKSVGAP
jgi:hypothetical protein